MNKVAAGIVEGLIIAVVGVMVAAVGNAARGDGGVDLTWDHFPSKKVDPDRPAPPPPPPPDNGLSPPVQPGIAPPRDRYVDADWFKVGPEEYEQFMGLDYVPMGKSHSWEFNELTSAQALAFFEAGQERGIVFLDSRTNSHWVDGHIPGAVSLSNFQFREFWPAAEATAMSAAGIVIYCAGGDCDDSKDLALSLVQQKGFPQERMFIYRGGMKDWSQEKRAIEKGEGQ